MAHREGRIIVPWVAVRLAVRSFARMVFAPALAALALPHPAAAQSLLALEAPLTERALALKPGDYLWDERAPITGPPCLYRRPSNWRPISRYQRST